MQPEPTKSEVLQKSAAAFNWKTCLHYDASPTECRGPIVRAHTVQKRGGLSRIALDGHVYWWRRTSADAVKQSAAVEPVWTGINEATTFTGFCAGHDSKTFRPVETKEFAGTQEQVGLMAYRTICMEIFAKTGAMKSAAFVERSIAGNRSPVRRKYSLWLTPTSSAWISECAI